MRCTCVFGGLFQFAALALVVPQAALAGGDLAGDYKIVEDGKVTWVVRIDAAAKGMGYQITWTEKSSGEAHTGLGVRDGDIFAASSSTNWVAVYRIKGNGNLVGKSYFQGKPKWSGSDTWIKIR